MQTSKSVDCTISLSTWLMQIATVVSWGRRRCQGSFEHAVTDDASNNRQVPPSTYKQMRSLWNLELMLLYFFFKALQEGESPNLPS